MPLTPCWHHHLLEFLVALLVLDLGERAVLSGRHAQHGTSLQPSSALAARRATTPLEGHPGGVTGLKKIDREKRL